MTELTVEELKSADPNPNEPELERALAEQLAVFAGYESDVLRVLLRAFIRSGRALRDSDAMAFLAAGLRAHFEPGRVLTEDTLYVRSWMPDTAVGDDEYSPRVLGHADPSALTDERLKELFERARAEEDIDREGACVDDEFERYLLRRGYRVLQTAPDVYGPFVAPVEG